MDRGLSLIGSNVDQMDWNARAVTFSKACILTGVHILGWRKNLAQDIDLNRDAFSSEHQTHIDDPLYHGFITLCINVEGGSKMPGVAISENQ